MSASRADRVRKRRVAIREAGLRPVQIWAPGFSDECRRQSLLVARHDAMDEDLERFLAAVASDVEGWADEMRRGDLVTVALRGDFGKPRPALVIQSDLFAEHSILTLLLVSSAIVEAPLPRFKVDPSAENGLRRPSQVMVDKAMTVARAKVGEPFGHLPMDAMLESYPGRHFA